MVHRRRFRQIQFEGRKLANYYCYFLETFPRSSIRHRAGAGIGFSAANDREAVERSTSRYRNQCGRLGGFEVWSDARLVHRAL